MSTASASSLSSGTSSSAASSASPAPAPSTSPRPGSSPSPLAAAAGAAASTAKPTVAVEAEADGTKNTAVAESNYSDSSKVADGSAPEHSSATHKPLPALPSPEDAASTSDSSSPAPRVVQVDGQPVALDALGPMVVGRDGTVSRIANWPEMTSHEREATLRVLGKRNQLRLANLRAGLPADRRQNSGEGASS